MYQIHNYDFDDLLLDVKYVSSSSFDDEGYTVLDHAKLNEVENM